MPTNADRLPPSVFVVAPRRVFTLLLPQSLQRSPFVFYRCTAASFLSAPLLSVCAMQSKKRGTPSASPSQSASATKRRKAVRSSVDHLAAVPSSILFHLLLPCLTFEEQMTHARQLNKTFHSLIDKCVLPWMNTRFREGLARISREESQMQKKREKRRVSPRLKERAISQAVPSSSSVAIVPPPTVAATSFTMADAVWVNRQLHVWHSKVYNRKVDLVRDELELLRVPRSKVASEFLLTGQFKARRVDKTVKDRRMASGFWLLDLLRLVFQRFGHIRAFLSQYEARKARKTELRSRQLKERAWQKDQGRLKAAMEAEGVDWSQWTWNEEETQWERGGATVRWRNRGTGVWRVRFPSAFMGIESYTVRQRAQKAVAALARASHAASASRRRSNTDDSDDDSDEAGDEDEEESEWDD